MKLSIGDVSEMMGVNPDTVRRWEKEGLIKSERTPGGHRRYNEEEILRFKQSRQKVKLEDKKAVGYARVSTKNKKDDLERQKQVLELFCAAKGWRYTIIEDIGSGLNYEKKGLRELICLIETNQIHTLVLNYKDRLLRYGSEILFEMCKWHKVDVIILNDDENKTYEEELVEDVLSIITVFSAKLYGSRSHKNKRIVEENEKLFKQ